MTTTVMNERRTITVTLSRKEWDTIVAAVAYYETVLEDQGRSTHSLDTAFSHLNSQWAQAHSQWERAIVHVDNAECFCGHSKGSHRRNCQHQECDCPEFADPTSYYRTWTPNPPPTA